MCLFSGVYSRTWAQGQAWTLFKEVSERLLSVHPASFPQAMTGTCVKDVSQTSCRQTRGQDVTHFLHSAADILMVSCVLFRYGWTSLSRCWVIWMNQLLNNKQEYQRVDSSKTCTPHMIPSQGLGKFHSSYIPWLNISQGWQKWACLCVVIKQHYYSL